MSKALVSSVRIRTSILMGLGILLGLGDAAAAELQSATPQTPQTVATRQADTTDRSDVLSSPARLNISNVALARALESLHRASGVPLVFSPSVLPDVVVSCSCGSQTVASALGQLLESTSLDFRLVGGQVVIGPRTGSDLGPGPVPSIASPRLPAGSPPDTRRVASRPTVRALTPTSRQSTGTIAGRVSSQLGQPLSAAQISINALDIGALSQTNGRFTLVVPEGTHTLTAQRIGYGQASVEVTVGAGQVLEQNFVLSEEAIQLDAVVVTGTAGGSQRRAVGNVVTSVNLADLSAGAPIASVESVLEGRIPGVRMMVGNNGAGNGGNIRIRAPSSIGLASDPIIYVDGVRLNDNVTQAQRHQAQSTLQDFDPANIESIEIIKGPAAATLYGTEASNGVIQIITKSGQAGATVIEATVEAGNLWLPNNEFVRRDAWVPDPAQCTSLPCASADQLISVNYDERDEELGFGSQWRAGLIQKYNLAARGGTDLIRYSFSLTRNHTDGVVKWSNDSRNIVRGNIDVTASERLSFSLSGGYNWGRYSPGGDYWAGNYGWGGTPATIFDGNDGPRGRHRNRQVESYNPERWEYFSLTKRNLWSLQTNVQATDWLTHRLTVGLDQRYEREEELYYRSGTSEFHGTAGLEGAKSITQRDEPVWTVDFAGTANVRLLEERLGTSSSYGMQYYRRERRAYQTNGENFAVSALTTVGSAAVTEANETFVENATLGFYVQEQLDWDNRMFLTGAVRADDNSAFGRDFDLAIYPKVSATWVVHEESFWNIDFINQMRLRAAWGQAGQQPDATAATTLFSPGTGPNAQPVLTAGQFGNPNLGPEKGQELEVGFDAAAFGGRLSVDFTYYNRVTKDAIVAKPIPASLWAGSASQFVNIGQLSAWGTETSISFQAIREGPVLWNLDLALTTSRNRIDDMGGLPGISVNRTQIHEEGFSIAALTAKRVVSADFVSGSQGAVTNIMCDSGTGRGGLEIGGTPVPCDQAPALIWGDTEPHWRVNLNSSWTLFGNLRAMVNIDAAGGNWMSSEYLGARHSSFQNSQLSLLQNDAIGMGALAVDRNMLTFHKADFAKLREVALSYSLPDAWVRRAGASNAAIRVGVRNLATLWRATEFVFGEPIADPEMNQGAYEFGGEASGGWPTMSEWTTRLSVTF